MVATDLDELARRLGPLARRREPLAPFCTYKVGGPAEIFVEVTSIEELEVVHEALEPVPAPILIVGKGSNLLVADRGFDGLVVMLGETFAEITVNPDTVNPGTVNPDDNTSYSTVRAGGLALLPVVARRTAAAGLTGFEWAVGVPGSIGGAVRMNAGGHGSDMAACLLAATVFDLTDGTSRSVPMADLGLGYRCSSITAGQIVVDATLRLAAGERDESEAQISEIVRWRRANQPGGQNAGSVFANPDGDSAGRLIDETGLKGLRIGTAEVSTKHANFIQADPNGSADDVYNLIRTVQTLVWEATGIELQPENRLIGFERGAR